MCLVVAKYHQKVRPHQLQDAVIVKVQLYGLLSGMECCHMAGIGCVREHQRRGPAEDYTAELTVPMLSCLL